MSDLRHYSVVTAAYWAFTLTDGALRMLVLLYFHEIGYSPLQIALLFVFYEFFGIITNLVGGWIAARSGLKLTLYAGLILQIVALMGLTALQTEWPHAWAVALVMSMQALSGIAKDLTKMSSKSAIKLVVPSGEQGRLFRWVAMLTGSKNALKGIGFFMGAALLQAIGFVPSLLAMAGMLVLAVLLCIGLLRGNLGKAKSKPKFGAMFSKSPEINWLSLARVFLFGARDVWFVVALPVFLYEVLGWSFQWVGAFMAIWVCGYGVVQAAAPALIRGGGKVPTGRAALFLALLLAGIMAGLALALDDRFGLRQDVAVISGLALFGVVFALNSSVHSFLIVAYSDRDKVAMNIGFYYMANATGRLIGTILSGFLFQKFQLIGCLWASAALALACGIISLKLPWRAIEGGNPQGSLANAA